MFEKTNDDETEQLPEITKIDVNARVGPEEKPAVVIWFGGEGALQYVWNDVHPDTDGEIREETYLDGVVRDSYGVGVDVGRRHLSSYALTTVSEYINVYRDNRRHMQQDWPHVHELLTAIEQRS